MKLHQIVKKLSLNPVNVSRDKNIEEWLKHRLNCVGSSLIPNILGLNSYTTRTAQLKKYISGDLHFQDTEHTFAGKLIEPIIQHVFNEFNTSGQLIIPCDKTFYSKDHPEFLSTPDGFVLTDGEVTHVNEVKMTSRDSDLWKTGRVPEWCECQCQWHMLVCGIDKALVTPMVCGNPRVTSQAIEVPFDGGYADFLVEQAKLFLDDVKQGRETGKVNIRRKSKNASTTIVESNY